VVQGGFASSGYNGSFQSSSRSAVEGIVSYLESAAVGERVQRLNSGQLQEAIGYAIVAAQQGEKINVVGHSFGGDTAKDVARALDQINLPVNVLATIDAVGIDSNMIPGNVRTNPNFIQGNTPFLHGEKNTPVNPSQTTVENIVRPEGHWGIATAPEVRDKIIKGILGQ
jgi:hypothetical protein